MSGALAWLRHVLAAFLARAAGRASRATGRGKGIAVAGRVLMALSPDSVRRLAQGRRIVLVAGTNGKTTTARMVAEAWRALGPVGLNDTGANLMSGVAATLLASKEDRLVLEVDELALPGVAAATSAEVVVLLNLARDQLDRMGEVAQHVDRWQAFLAASHRARLVVNADDPLLVAVASDTPHDTTWVGAGLLWHEDARMCRACGHRIDFADEGWRCSSCPMARPPVDATRSNDCLVLADGRSLQIRLDGLPGEANYANAAMAVMAAQELGVEPAVAIERIGRLGPVQGRFATGTIGGYGVRLLLMKNPASALNDLMVIRESEAPVVISINAEAADGRDPSWLWDVRFDSLRGRRVIACGRRSADLSVRLRYAEVEHTVAQTLADALAEASAPSCDVLADYTSFSAALRQIALPQAVA